MTDNEILAEVLKNFMSNQLNWSDVIGNNTLVLDGMVDLTEVQAAAVKKLWEGEG